MGFHDTPSENDMRNILVFPSGDLNKDKLFDIIDDALHEGLAPAEKISFWVHKRVPWFNPSDPSYQTVSKTRTLRTLMRWYKEMTGHPFDPKFAKPLPATMIGLIVYNPNTGNVWLEDIGS